jgi:hypothetical protein
MVGVKIASRLAALPDALLCHQGCPRVPIPMTFLECVNPTLNLEAFTTRQPRSLQTFRSAEDYLFFI